MLWISTIISIVILTTLLLCIQYWCRRCNPILANDNERAKSIAVAIAFAVGAADGNISGEEADIIKFWAQKHLGKKNDRSLHRALTRTRVFFQNGNKIDAESMCFEMVICSNISYRYELIELCMQVVSADGTASAKELIFLRNLAKWLELDKNKFHSLMEFNVPVNIHQIKDIEFILGIDNTLGREEIEKKLNHEYRKWNSRVTNTDESIRTQAQAMIQLISDAKQKFQKLTPLGSV